LLEELLDALDMLLGEIEGEVEVGQAAQLKALDELVADEAGSVFKRLDGVGLLFGVFGADTDEDAGVLHVGLHADFADADIAFEARVFEFAGKHGIDFVSDFFAYAFVSVMVGHVGCKLQVRSCYFSDPYRIAAFL